jgi:flavodoxin
MKPFSRRMRTLNPRREWNTYLMAILLAVIFLGSCSCSMSRMDAVSRATTVVSTHIDGNDGEASGRALMIRVSAPGGSTEKIARAMAAALGARVLSPAEAQAADLSACGIMGFGSGIMDQKHHEALLSFVDALPPQEGKKAFIFSTSGISRQYALEHGTDDPHTLLRRKLVEKGFAIAGEFNCEGFNVNSFLKFFGGMNKGRPNQEDLARAEAFARGLMVAEEAP